MLALCLYAIIALAVQTLVRIDEEVRSVIDFADAAVCALFFVDFWISLLRAENRWKYLTTWGWLDLLSSIPMLDVGRWGRIARIVRIFRVLRGFRGSRVLAEVILRRRAESTALAASLVAILLIALCSVAVLQFETDPESNIKTADQAIWWAVSTISTVGYGDYYPVTGEGRLVAMILMSAGVGLFGTFSGLLASWFLAHDEQRIESDLGELRAEVAALRATIEGQSRFP